MAWTKSGLYIATMSALIKQTALTGETRGTGVFLTTTNKIALHSNSLTDGTAPINFSAASSTWANTSEVSGTGWAAGGVLFSAAAAGATSIAPTLTESPTGSLMYDATDVSVASTTLTNLRGCIMYADAITATQIDAMVIAITFGADYSTVAGTLTITFDVLGIAAIDITP
jgi:hypothetical protein